MQHSSVRLFKTPLLLVAMLFSAILVAGVLSQPAHAQTYNVLYSFQGGSNGYSPSDIMVAPNGTIYGSAFYGVGCACNLIFSFADTKLTVLHRWSEPSGHNAAEPLGLLLDRDTDVLYATAQFGGPTNYNCFADAGDACGSVFSYDLTAKNIKSYITSAACLTAWIRRAFRFLLPTIFTELPGEAAQGAGDLSTESAWPVRRKFSIPS